MTKLPQSQVKEKKTKKKLKRVRRKEKKLPVELAFQEYCEPNVFYCSCPDCRGHYEYESAL